MKIRQYQEKDNEKLIKLIENSLYQIFKVKPKKIELDNELFKKGGILYVAEEKGYIVGSVGIKRQKKRIARLKKIYVSKTYRRKGLGQRLYNKAELFARKNSYQKIILSTTPQMREAIEFYKKNCFEYYRSNKKNQLYFRKIL